MTLCVHVWMKLYGGGGLQALINGAAPEVHAWMAPCVCGVGWRARCTQVPGKEPPDDG